MIQNLQSNESYHLEQEHYDYAKLNYHLKRKLVYRRVHSYKWTIGEAINTRNLGKGGKRGRGKINEMPML